MTTEVSRVIFDTGEFEGNGFCLLCIGAMHGNEKAGIEALNLAKSVLQKPNLNSGRVIGIKGNIKAIEKNQRYIDVDLNRIWTLENILNPNFTIYEHQQLIEIYDYIDDLFFQYGPRLVILDLHTFSSEGGFFGFAAKNKQSFKFLSKIGVPVIKGLSDNLEGTALEFWGNKGLVSFAFEGGNHLSEIAPHNLCTVIFKSAEQLGIIKKELIPEPYKNFKQKIKVKLPHYLTLTYRHGVKAGDNFKMLEGFTNFQTVQEGQLLAKDKNGNILAPLSGYLLMPLYQPKGEDGFFIAEELIDENQGSGTNSILTELTQ